MPPPRLAVYVPKEEGYEEYSEGLGGGRLTVERPGGGKTVVGLVNGCTMCDGEVATHEVTTYSRLSDESRCCTKTWRRALRTSRRRSLRDELGMMRSHGTPFGCRKVFPLHSSPLWMIDCPNP